MLRSGSGVVARVVSPGTSVGAADVEAASANAAAISLCSGTGGIGVDGASGKLSLWSVVGV